MKPIIAKALEIARAQIGVRESNDNSGAKVQEYQAATTLGGTHWPWCAALIAWDFRETEKALDIEIPWTYSASCDVLLADAKARALLRTAPEPGDVGLVRARKPARSGGGYSNTDAVHTFLVDKVLPDGSFTTVEGNTNSDGGREGIGVMSHLRRNDGRYFFVRWADAVPEPKPLAPYTASVQIPKGSDGATVRALPSITGNNSVLVSARDWGAILGKTVTWNAQNGEVSFDGEEVPLQPRLIGGTAYFPLRALCDLVGGTMIVDPVARTAKAVLSK